jgi:hypothetical protein
MKEEEFSLRKVGRRWREGCVNGEDEEADSVCCSYCGK